MKPVILSIALFGIALVPQVRVDAPPGVEVPQDEVQAAYRVGREVVLNEVAPAKRDRIPEPEVTLSIGSCSQAHGEYVETDEVQNGHAVKSVNIVCLSKWDVEKFTYAIMRITERRLIAPNRYRPLLSEGMKKVQFISPVNAKDLEERARPNR